MKSALRLKGDQPTTSLIHSHNDQTANVQSSFGPIQYCALKTPVGNANYFKLRN